ncbi:DUF427 domain-containing protein [Actinoplanes siamensis]|uniref:DUF427 domain-containing protein n=2 Tax=Actinoplanes siamensis TaxID=1223317 RepID=A0A919N6Z3_9ACTN|nr:hypothetical protein Asi03nite_29670 [Actinoplanes siamensis]
MSLNVGDEMMRLSGVLRHASTGKWVRAKLGGPLVVDSRAALLLWEPRRIVPTYAVPDKDVRAELVPVGPAADSDVPVLHPGIPFAVHSTPGQPYDVHVGHDVRERAAFRPGDADLAGHVAFDFDAFDWTEEDEPLFAHPRDPFSRVDARRSSRHVRIERDGVLLAESHTPTLVFETKLCPRFYLPREDLKAEVLPSDMVTACPYKGRATYLSFAVGVNLAWTYPDPLPEASPLAGLVAFFDEVVDVTVDGVARDRPDSPVARIMKEEFGVSAQTRPDGSHAPHRDRGHPVRG